MTIQAKHFMLRQLAKETIEIMPADFLRLLEISQKMSQIQSLIPLLTYAMDMAIELINAEFGYLGLFDEQGEFKVRIARTNMGETLDDPKKQMSQTILEQTLTGQKPILYSNAEEILQTQSAKALKLKSIISLPLIQDGRMIGVIYLENRKASVMFDEAGLKLIERFADEASPSIYNALLNESLENEMTARAEYLDTDNTSLSFFAEWIVRRFRLNSLMIQLLINGEYEEIAKYPKKAEKYQSEYPLRYQGESLGKVLYQIAERPLTTDEDELFRRIMYQVSIASHNHILNQRLKQSIETLVRSLEEERQGLRQNLHDDLGPQIAALLLHIDTAKNLIAQNPENAQKKLDDIKNIAKKVLVDLRHIAHDLRPPTLDELGLRMALNALVNQLSSLTTRIDLELPNDLPVLHPAIEAAAYRIVAEALNNVVSHAQATDCLVLFSLDNNGIIIEIQDNGVGMNPKSHFSLGLTSMRQRAEVLGGRFQLESETGNGTKISAFLPLVK